MSEARTKTSLQLAKEEIAVAKGLPEPTLTPEMQSLAVRLVKLRLQQRELEKEDKEIAAALEEQMAARQLDRLPTSKGVVRLVRSQRDVWDEDGLSSALDELTRGVVFPATPALDKEALAELLAKHPKAEELTSRFCRRAQSFSLRVE